MPQMMPINWILSFILFILIFIIFNIMNYYIFNIYKKKKMFHYKNSNNLFWKW
uniref:ATP synthase F0 subunit 8 n=1 Tax=Capila translucida TaxID=1663117 RepID=UPI001EE105AD|nr:ATP synthase F0 subunit 8 [Capila translucida]UJV31516.1 ATP synthase F0 subunit 8 [Capila translucida]